MQNDYTCPGCKKRVGQSDVRGHVNTCSEYDSEILTLIRKLNGTDDKDYLKYKLEEISLARSHLQKVFAQSSKKHSQIIKFDQQQDDLGFQQIVSEKPVRISSEGNNRGSYRKTYKNKMQEEQNVLAFDERDMVKCHMCQKNFYSSFDIDRLMYIEECWHLFCKPCVRKYVDNEFVNSGGYPKCPEKECANRIPEHQLKGMLGDKFQGLQNKAFRKTYNIVQCVKCNSQYDFQPGNPNDAPKKDTNGKPLKPEHAILYAENRFNCPKNDCKTEQCKQCQATPYHLGMDCKQYKSRALMMKCRYCDTPITQKNQSKTMVQAHADICNDKQCQAAAKTACVKTLECGHSCSGIRGQSQCLPCLREGCCEKQESLNGQTGDDYCAICYVESLQAAPSIQCGCGHIFHMKCVKKRLQIKWLTPRILFNFCLCPLCKKWIDVPKDNQLNKPIQDNQVLFAKIQKMSLDRLKFEELQNDEKLTNKTSPYFNKPSEYAMAIYAYFMCFKCKNPYFGGRKNCAEAMNEQNVQGFKPEQLVCPNCCDIPIENCPKHGKDFIQFKCKFCCSVAQWFCWGNTHFCEPCHKKQCSGDYVSKYTKDKLPKCQGPGKCPTGGNHNGNGQQMMLGCAICRNYKQNQKAF